MQHPVATGDTSAIRLRSGSARVGVRTTMTLVRVAGDEPGDEEHQPDLRLEVPLVPEAPDYRRVQVWSDSCRAQLVSKMADDWSHYVETLGVEYASRL